MPSGSERQHPAVSEVGVFCSMHQAILLPHTNLSYIATFLSGKGPFQLHLPPLLWLPHRQTAVMVQKGTFLCTVLPKLLSLVWRKQIKCGSHKKNLQ